MEPASDQRALRLLVVDDILGEQGEVGDRARQALLEVVGHADRFTFTSAWNAFVERYDYREVAAEILRCKPDVLLLDVEFGEQSNFGFDILSEVSEAFPMLPVVMFTTLERESNLDYALAHGAVDFVNKDSVDYEIFWGTVLRYSEPDSQRWLIGQNGEYQQAIYLAGRAARNKNSVLIQGGIGSGADHLADYVHRLAAHFHGAETAAEIAILSGVDSYDAAEQLMALRKARSIQEAGGFIIATSRDPLIGLVKRGVFRKDLFEAVSSGRQLGTNVVQLPLLRDRVSDVPALMRHRLLQRAQALGRSHIAAPSQAFLDALIVELRRDGEASLDQYADLWLEAECDEQTAIARLVPEEAEEKQPVQCSSARLGSRRHYSDVDSFLKRVESHAEPYRVKVAGMNIKVLPGVFSPRYSHSSDFLIEHLPDCREQRVLDVGCGTGVLGLAALKLRDAAHCTFIDINEDAIENTRENLAEFGFTDRARVMVSDMFDAVEGRFDLIISNPPFWDRRPRTMLERSCFDADHQFLRTLLQEAASYMNSTSQLALVMSDQADVALLYRELTSNGWYLEKTVFQPTRSAQGTSHVRIVCIASRRRGS